MYLLGKTYQEIADQTGLTKSKARETIRHSDYYKPKPHPSNQYQTEDALPEKIEYKADGSIVSERVLALTDEQRADRLTIVAAMGIQDPEQWVIQSLILNLYHQQKRGGGKVPLYQCKVTLKPRQDKWHEIIQHLETKTKPFTAMPVSVTHGDRYLLVAINDTHFGPNTADDYAESQAAIIHLIETNRYKQVLIFMGGDIFNANSGTSETVHGTRVTDFDMDTAWIEAERYIEPIIVTGLQHAGSIELVQSPGNHSETMEFGFAKTIAARFSQLKVDCKQGVWIKARLLGKNLIGLSHGYKNQKNTPINLALDYPELWGQSTHRECIVAHKHIESSDQGVLLRVMPTRADDNERYVRENNFVRSHKAFLCLEYSETDVKSIHYV